MKTVVKGIVLFALGVALIGALTSTFVLQRINQIIFDLGHENETVLSVEDARLVLGYLDRLDYSELDSAYLEYTGFMLPPYREFIEGSQFYVLKDRDVFRKVAGNIRIKDFLPKDQFLEHSLRGLNNQVYWQVDPDLIYAIIELQRQLILNKYDYRAFKVISAYRYPSYNEKVGGVCNSQHIRGKAVDIYVGDINMDGRYTSEDKEQIYQILNECILTCEGGIGRYPERRTIHFDVRPELARWDR